jgi:hypothetical protein
VSKQEIPDDTLIKLVSTVSQIKAISTSTEKRLSVIESAPSHVCLHEDKVEEIPLIKEKAEKVDKLEEVVIANNNRGIATETTLAGLSKWRYGLMSAILVVATYVATCSLTSRDTVTTHSEQISTNADDINDNKSAIKTGNTKTQKTREAVIRIDQHIKNQAKTVKPPEEDGAFVSVKVDNLRPFEKRQLQRLEKLARER